MRTFLGMLLAATLLTSCSTPQGPATKLEKANVLPLALNDNFQFRKAELFFYNEASSTVPTENEMISFQRKRIEYGTITTFDRQQRYGNYFTFFWRTSETADVIVRLEYRQASMGNYVMAQERYYPSARGSYQSDFAVIGDDYREQGRVTSWRALLIVDGKIVALKQSFIWK